jgi:hypothetical protein
MAASDQGRLIFSDNSEQLMARLDEVESNLAV